MHMKEKERYSAPETEVLRLHPEGVMCASPDYMFYFDPSNPFENNQEEDW